MDFEEKINKFTDEHPVWTWVLARLIICICGCTIVANVFFAVLVIAVPFVLISNGAGWEAFAVWFWLPLIATFVWMMGSVISYVWAEVLYL